MADKVTIKIKTTEHIYNSGILVGLALARECLDDKSMNLPGIGLARALIDKQLAERRAPFMMGNIKAVAKDGHDVQTVKSICTVSETEIEVEFYDLADLAEQKE